MNPAILSLHDVMPETFPQMEAILKYLRDHRIPPITLLVVPGRQWKSHQIDHLRCLADQGYTLAAHGWVHRTDQPSDIYHRLHARLLSRNVAEHLALDAAGIRDLMQRSFDWFGDNDLPPPTLYVPPAWALGRLPRHDLGELPYTAVEVLRGIYLPKAGHFYSLPMIGFEADTAFRKAAVHSWNAGQTILARLGGRPLRIGLHPSDFQLSMAETLRQVLAQPFIWQSYDEALQFVTGRIPAAT
jgi:predicted deacetylase